MAEDIVRVLRVLEYIGPRSWIESTMAGNGVKGERRIDSNKIIREAVLGQSHEIIQKDSKDSNLVRHAERELRLAGLFEPDSDYGGALGPAILNLVREFSSEGHSGASAAVAIKIFQKVANFEPLTPLTGEPDEWNEVGTNLFQNKRCSHVFKEGNHTYDSEGRIFRESNGSCHMTSNSRVDITFPYTPHTEYIDVPS